MADTALGNVLEFFQDLGVYDVVLPFILTFTIMFAILERTKLFGTEGKDQVTKKNLNAMVSFVVAFMVVASSKLVATITKISSEIIIVLLTLVFLLMLIGTLRTHEEIGKGELVKEKVMMGALIALVSISMIFITLDAIETEDGDTWLEVFWDWLGGFYDNAAVGAIVLIIVIILIMLFVTGAFGGGGKPS